MSLSNIQLGANVDGRSTRPAGEVTTASTEGASSPRDNTVSRIRSAFYGDANPLMEYAMRVQQMAESRMLRSNLRHD